MKPNLITSDVIWNKMDTIERMLKNFGARNNLFNALLVNDIVKDMKVTAEYVIKNWLETGLLPAIKLKDEDRKKGGWRISRTDYIEFLEKFFYEVQPEKQKIIFLEDPKQIVKRMQKELGIETKKNKKVAA